MTFWKNQFNFVPGKERETMTYGTKARYKPKVWYGKMGVLRENEF